MNENPETTETNGETPAFRSTRQLRSDVEKGIGEVRAAKDEWAEALRQQERERDAQNGMATYGQMKELVGRRELAELQNGQRAQDAIASALAIARENGGRLPGEVTDYLNRQFGFDGKTSGIMDGGIDPETGEFGFVFGERDRDGNVATRRQTIPMPVQLGLMEGYPGLFDGESVKAHRQKMLDSGRFSSGELDAYSRVARLSRDRLAKRMEELTPRDARLETEKLRQQGMDRRADMRQEQFAQRLELQRRQLEEQVQKRIAASESAEERNAILKEAKEAELKLRQEEIERKYTQMAMQYGTGETRNAAQSKTVGKLASTQGGNAPATQNGAKKIKGYQTKTVDGKKMRRAVYSDGTFGEPFPADEQ